MRNLFILIVLLSGFDSLAAPIRNTSSSSISKINVEKPKKTTSIASLKIGDIQKLLGRKLTLKERVGLFILKHKLKHAPKETSSGKTALIFSIIGVTLLVIGLFAPPLLIGAFIAALIGIVLGSIAKKRDSSNGKAQAALLVGWITIGLLALLLLLAAIVVAGWSWGW